MKALCFFYIMLLCFSTCNNSQKHSPLDISPEEERRLKEERELQFKQFDEREKMADTLEAKVLSLTLTKVEVDDNFNSFCHFKVTNISNRIITSFLVGTIYGGKVELIKKKLKPNQSYKFKLPGCKSAGIGISHFQRIIGVRFDNGQAIMVQ